MEVDPWSSWSSWSGCLSVVRLVWPAFPWSNRQTRLGVAAAEKLWCSAMGRRHSCRRLLEINNRDRGKQHNVPHRARGKGPRRDDWTHAREARARSSRTLAKGGSVAQPARTTPPRAKQTSGEAHAQMEKITRLSLAYSLIRPVMVRPVLQTGHQCTGGEALQVGLHLPPTARAV